jgi:predicted metal-binding protein
MDIQGQDLGSDLAILIREACLAGATEVMPVTPAEIVVEERLAGYCREPQCPNFGQSPSCPPHVAGPAGFLALRDSSRAALVVRIEVPSAVLFSVERREVMRLLHEITAGIERSAIARGYTGSKAFAGGSCKDLFCHDHLSCQILAGSGKCRNPTQARPSMSGFGINVAKMLQAAGCSEAKSTRPAIPGVESMSWLAGLVLIA